MTTPADIAALAARLRGIDPEELPATAIGIAHQAADALETVARERDEARAMVEKWELEINTLKQEASAFRDAVNNELVTMGLTIDSYPDARTAVRAAIDLEVSIALDPQVSAAARALMDRGWDAAQDDNARLRAALEEAEGFVDSHSEPWYKSGQALLARIRAALKGDQS